MKRLLVGLAAMTAMVVLPALALVLVPAATATAAPRATATEILLPTSGWHGRAVRQPHAHDTARASTPGPVPGWSAGPAELGTGSHRAAGSRRVREVQERLRRLGYATGRIDGIFGSRTRAAVGWFQRKHGLRVDGRATEATVRHLRARTGAAGTPAPEPPAAPAPVPADAAPAPPTTTAVPVPSASGDSPLDLTVPALLLAGLGLAAAGFALARRTPTAGAAPSVIPVRHPGPAPATPGGTRALGYVRLAPGARSASFHAQAAAIEAGCLARGLTLVSLVSDLEPDRRAAEPPPALAFALDRLGERDVDRLVVSRLDHLARSRDEARDLLHTITQRDAGLVVLDRDLDTIELDEPEALDRLLVDAPAVRLRPRGPEDLRPVDAHIASMLQDGLDPGTIATALNAEPVAPPRGSRWGSSGIEEALRRRRADAAPTEVRDV